MAAPVPPHVRDRTVAVVAWVLAVASWIVPVGLVAGALFGLLWLFQRGTGRVPLAACACAGLAFAMQAWLLVSVS